MPSLMNWRKGGKYTEMGFKGLKGEVR